MIAVSSSSLIIHLVVVSALDGPGNGNGNGNGSGSGLGEQFLHHTSQPLMPMEIDNVNGHGNGVQLFLHDTFQLWWPWHSPATPIQGQHGPNIVTKPSKLSDITNP